MSRKLEELRKYFNDTVAHWGNINEVDLHRLTLQVLAEQSRRIDELQDELKRLRKQ